MGNLSSIVTYPQTGWQLVASLEAALLADEAQGLSLTPGSLPVLAPGASLPANGGVNASGADQTMVGGRLIFAPLAVPAAPVVTVAGGTGTSYIYKVEALLGLGTSGSSAVSNTGSGGATLSATVYNTIVFTPVAGATSYNIRRTTGGTTQGVIKNVLATGAATYTVVDNGLVGDSTVAPSLNTTGLIAAPEQPPLQVISAGTGAITIPSGRVLLTQGSAGAYTLQLPVSGAASAGGTNGCVLNITTMGAYQHTVTTGAAGYDSASTIFTFAATAKTTVTLVANGSTWSVITLGGGALS